MSLYDWDGWPRHVSAEERRRSARRVAKKLTKQGRRLDPVEPRGRKVTTTFWGKAWCDNLVSYTDYANRLPRGMSYLRQGAVIDLRIGEGLVQALVHGSELYKVRVAIRPVPKPRWTKIKRQCAGQIASLVDLLRGRLSPAVMQSIARPDDGLFPTPAAMRFKCSCPDYATMCKHVAAVLYGVGVRLDDRPELLFTLRKVDHLQLIGEAPAAAATKRPKKASGPAVDAAELGSVFGIELAEPPAPRAKPRVKEGSKLSTARGR